MVSSLQSQIVVLLHGDGVAQHMASQAQSYSVQNYMGIQERFK